MNKAELYGALDKVNHSREQRFEMARRILRSEDVMGTLLELAFDRTDPVCIKACWVLEFTVREQASSLHPYLDCFTGQIPHVSHESAIRPLARICESLLQDYFSPTGTTHAILTSDHMEKITAVCFDWLIGDHKVAAKAYSMSCLLLLGRKFDWIHPELRYVLEHNYAHESAAYKARARHALSHLQKLA